MHFSSETTIDERPARRAGRRFLRIFVICVISIAALVAGVNLVAYRYMLADHNQAIVQLLSGWGRTYKPILHDEIEPGVVVFGASWARDGFDPIETGKLLGRTVFNHGVSGGTAYETRRFADSALANPNLEVAIVNLNTFYRDKSAARFRYGFDESVLTVDADLGVNRFVGLRRAYSLALGGWAVGANIKLIDTILKRDRGIDISEYLESYEHGNLTRRNLKKYRKRIFADADDRPAIADDALLRKPVPVEEEELSLMIDRLCARGVDVYAYFTPSHVRQQSCDLSASEELAALEFLRGKQRGCTARIRYFNFSYPNAMTLEGVLKPVRASRYYRPDGHPRPTAGLAMAASMFDKPFPPGTLPELAQDFGVDLISHADAEGWLLERVARCRGDWGEQGFAAIKKALRGAD